MKSLFKTGNENKTVSQIEFGILSIDEVVQQSHVKIYNNDIYDDLQNPVENGLMDPRMGTCNNNKCKVCEQDKKFCMGHFGYISLSNYLFPFGFLKDIVKILKCICKNCGHILLSKGDQMKFEKLIRKTNLSYTAKKDIRIKIINLSKKVRYCDNCKTSNGNVKKVKALSMIYHQKYIRKDPMEKYTERFINNSSDIQDLVKNGVELLRPCDVYKLLQLVPMKHYKFLGMDAKDRMKLSNIVYKHITVPPNSIRPSTLTEAVNQSREDDITILLRMQLTGKLNEMHSEYARMINPSTSCLRSTKDKNFTRGMAQRLAGKKGRFRGNIMGKRTNFTSRTVISPDPYLKINQVAIPEYCAVRLTYTDVVTPHNFDHLRMVLLNGPNVHPGAIGFASCSEDYLQTPMNHMTKTLSNDIRWQQLHKKAWRERIVKEMKIGDLVERHIDNGDIVLFNRQPSLHRLSFQSFEVVVKKSKTFSFNPCCCNPFNADFDGDEMNVHFPQTREAAAEAKSLISSIKNVTSPNSGEPLTAPLQDILTAAYLLSSKDSFYTPREFHQLAMRIQKCCPPDKFLRIPKPAILHPTRLYTGKQLISLVISPFSTKHPNCNELIPSSRINLTYELKPSNNEDYFLNSSDSLIMVHNSDLVMGQLTKKVLGSGSKASIFYRLFNDVSNEASCQAMERLCQVALTDLKDKGFSIGITDVSPGVYLKQKQKDLVIENFKICEEYIRSYENRTLVCDPGCSLEETLESKVSSQLSKIRDEGGKECVSILQKKNAPLIMALCGSKGSLINISQMIFCVGQQIISGKRVSNISGTNRTLMFCPVKCRSPMSRGFVSNSFYSGLNPVEFLFHAMSGREGLIDTAVKTAETGYMQRRLIKCLEDLAIRYDKTARDFQGSLFQFKYGADGFDPSKLETSACPCDFDKELYHALQFIFNCNDSPLFVPDALIELQSILTDKSDEFDQLKDSLMTTVTKYLASNEGEKFGINRTQIKIFVDNCFKKFQQAVIDPGTAVGVICGQSVGEPATQMTLKTFHFAGVASMNITQGVPRMQEIMNAVKNIKTPIITVSLTDPKNPDFAKLTQKKIQPVFLRELITCSEEILCSTGMFFYLRLDHKKIIDLSITQEHLQVALSKVKLNVPMMSVVFKENGSMHIEIFSETEINCQVVLQVLGKVQIIGANNVIRTVIQRDSKEVLNIYVEGGKLSDVCQIPGVDGYNTVSNHIHEIFDVLGIEAAKNVIISELNSVMDSHNLTPDIRHVMLLADMMCYTGQICGFQRSGMSKSKNSVLCLASFEKTLDHLFEASYHNQVDKLHGVSDCLTFGKTIPLGTGMHSVLWDPKMTRSLKRRHFLMSEN